MVEVDELLKLPATGREQDWEYEFSDVQRIPEILVHLELGGRDAACEDALSLLLLASIDEAEQAELLTETYADRTSKWFKANPETQEKMIFYWVILQKANKPELLRRMLGAEA